jgi:hypothetical protein
MERTAALAAALAFVSLLGGLTVYVAIVSGPSVLTVVSLLVLAMLAFGIVGALRHPPHQ